MVSNDKKAAIFIANYTIANSPSILNFLTLLSAHYDVDLYIRHCGLKEGLKSFQGRLRVIEVVDSKSLRFLFNRISCRNRTYDAFICFDPHGLVLCDELFPEAKPFYYSLELYLKHDHFGLDYSDEIAKRERQIVRRIRGLIIQSKEKERLFLEDHQLPDAVPVFILPVTGNGKPVKEKSNYLFEKYNIPSGKKIALHLGGIASWFSCLEIAQLFGERKDWVLFFQGYADPNYLADMKKNLACSAIKNIEFSEEIFQTPDQLEPVLMSSSIGIAWYNNISAGFRTAGRSSGKIASYLKYGLPIITNTYPSMVEAIERTGCGVCIDTIEQISDSLDAIEQNYAFYSGNALEEYSRSYRFEVYAQQIMDFIRETQ